MNKYQKALEHIKQVLGDLIDFNGCKESIKILEELVEHTKIMKQMCYLGRSNNDY